MRTLRGKLILLLLVSALLPLAIYGVLSLYNSQKILKTTIQDSYAEIAKRTAGEISLYLEHARALLETLVADLANTDLSAGQTRRIVENYVIRFSEFERILLFDSAMQATLSTDAKTSKEDQPPVALLQEAAAGRPNFSKAYLSADLTPVIWYLVPMRAGTKVQGVLAAQIDLMRMWEWVGGTQLGKGGYVTVVDRSGQVVASGDPFYKQAILSSDSDVSFEGFSEKLSSSPTIRQTGRGNFLLALQPISEAPPWYVVFAQPVQEAFAPLRTMTWELLLLIAGSVILMLLAGFWISRRLLLKPVGQLALATQALGKGDLSYRLPSLGGDEFGRLGESFNRMSEDLLVLQETTRRQERLAMFGRIASGLAHDLKHPVKNIENAAKVMETMYEDENYRQTFRRIVQREFNRINQFLDDLRNLTHEMPYHPISFDLVKMLRDSLESFQIEAANRKIELKLSAAAELIPVVGDVSLLRRLFENLIANAIQAFKDPDGLVEVRLRTEGDQVLAEVADTGPGIPAEKIDGLFEEFITTKRKGLGLGLAIAKKIMALHQGEIRVESQVGLGTTFHLAWPAKAG
ncbi:MAG TPA: sensor histidine kinase [bacterium]|nr:sensor histidine kinase [bacterium]